MTDFKYNEDNLIKELQDYVESTYNQHYAKGKYQATDVILDAGHGEGFCIGNIIKYAKRYGKKGTSEDHRKDLMKVLHYALIMLHVHDSKSPEQFTEDDTYNPDDLCLDQPVPGDLIKNHSSIDDLSPEDWTRFSRNTSNT